MNKTNAIYSISAAQARVMFPNLRGQICGAHQHRHGFIVDMGPRAYAVMVDGSFMACCPTVQLAAAFIEKLSRAQVAA